MQVVGGGGSDGGADDGVSAVLGGSGHGDAVLKVSWNVS